MISVFDYLKYKDYLNDLIFSLPAKGRGIRLSLSKYLNCQTAYISQVLNQSTNFSLEQAAKINSFFNHNKIESRFFILLVQLERAGNIELQNYLNEEIKEILDNRSDIKERINITDFLDESNQHIYYSVWYYAAIHILLSIPEFQSIDSISKHLNLPVSKIHEVIEFLTKTGLAEQIGNRYVVGQTRIHLSKDSSQIQRHHTNWRHQAIQSIDKNEKEDLHYSSVISMGDKDVKKIKEILLKSIEHSREIIRSSPEERLQILTMDFFKL